MSRVAAFIVNYNMPERADALAEHIKWSVKTPVDIYLIDNGSDIAPQALYTTVRVTPNRQTTGGWLAGLSHVDKLERKYFAYWFLITSTEFTAQSGDVLTPMVEFMSETPHAVGIHPALTDDSTTSWSQLYRRGGDKPRRTWMIDNIASLWRAEWFDSIGRFDPEMIYGWGIDLETCFKARQQGLSLWVDERVIVKKVTNIGYKMDRMNMKSNDRERLAGANMRAVLSKKYGPQWLELMTQARVDDAWR